jgi:hypothetical protein
MLWCIAPAPAVSVAGQLRLEEIRQCVEGALNDVGWQHKDLAAAMGFGGLTRIGLYYRQLRVHGLNLNLLLNAEPAWLLAFMVRICRLLGITNEQIAKAFGIDIESEEARRQKDEAFDRRLRRLEALAGVPAPDTDSPAEEAPPDGAKASSSARAREGGGVRGGPAVAADLDLLPVQVPLQVPGDVRHRVVVSRLAR